MRTFALLGFALLCAVSPFIAACNDDTGHEEAYVNDRSTRSTCEGLIREIDSSAAHPILFDYGRGNLRPDEQRDLILIAHVVASYGCSIVVEGHADEEEEDRYALSELRARMVYSLLLENGVEPRQIDGVYGLGSSDPIGRPDTPEGRQLNRRVELTILNY
jgi:outer membrane protein OmpA-like peptidoglycan-associated protein